MKKFKVSIKSSDDPNQEKLKLGLDTIVAIAIRIFLYQVSTDFYI